MRVGMGLGLIIGLALLSVSCAHQRIKYFCLDSSEFSPFVDIRPSEELPRSEAAILVVEYPTVVGFSPPERFAPQLGPSNAKEIYFIQIPPGKQDVEIGVRHERIRSISTDYFYQPPAIPGGSYFGSTDSSFWWRIRASGSISWSFNAIPGHVYCIKFEKVRRGERCDEQQPIIRSGRKKLRAALVDCTGEYAEER
jgi:hypothetical protein